MSDILDTIQSLENISSELEPSETERNSLLNQIQKYSNSFLNSINKIKSYSNHSVDSNKFSFDGNKTELKELLNMYDCDVTNNGIVASSGGHIGYIPGGGLYTSALADYIADVTNEYAGMYYASPGAVTIENEMINWLKSIFNFPTSAIGNLTSGGSIANLIALTAARDNHQIKSEKIKSSVIYLSPQAHHCIQKALRIIGLEDVQIKYLDLDENHKIKTNNLNSIIENDKKNGLNPFLIIASAGTTDTGAVDPLLEIGEIAKKNNLWYHIDGAYGGFFILTESKKILFKGIELADSLVIDPHKGLFLPYGIGAVLVKNKEAVFKSNHYTANYMQDAVKDNTPLNPADVSPELTKHFRGLRMWLPLKLHGIKPFIACLEEKILLTTYFRNKLIELGFKVGPEPDLSVSYFWYPSTIIDENTFNKRLMEEIHKDGSIFLSSTLINKQFVIRMAILSFRTKLATIDKAINMIENAKKEVEQSLKILK